MGIKLKELKEWLETLPQEFDEYDLVNAEMGGILHENYNSTALTYRLYKPIVAFTADEKNGEIFFLNSPPKDNRFTQN